MSNPVDLLLITHNRGQYVEKTVPTLLADPNDFRLYCWDNASTDGTADLISSIDDPRVVTKHFCKENLNQREPCLWFFEQAQSELIGKVDDDILLPAGWTERFRKIFDREPKAGMLGCWIFMKEEWREPNPANVINFGGEHLLRGIGMSGHSFLARRSLVQRYITPPELYGLPIDRTKISLDGWITGLPIPPSFAHNMDDPRSPHCIFTHGNLHSAQGALTARKLGFADAKAYGKWIAADARRVLQEPFENQLSRARFERRTDPLARLQRKGKKIIAKASQYLKRPHFAK